MKRLFILFIFGTLVTGASYSSDKYVSVRYDAAMNTNFGMVRFIEFPREVYTIHKSGKKEFLDANSLHLKDKEGTPYHEITFLNRDECAALVKENIDEESKKFDDENAIVTDGYVIDYWHYHAMMCIPQDVYEISEENCGIIVGADYDELFMPDTPFVCEKYSANNPIPKTSRERWMGDEE